MSTTMTMTATTTTMRGAVPGRDSGYGSGGGDGEGGDPNVADDPVLMLVAVAGDAALDAVLERLLSGEPPSASAHTDRNSLAGGVLVLMGPVSETAAGDAAERCRLARVALVLVAPEVGRRGCSGVKPGSNPPRLGD
jgi:hypothetical protein